MHCHLEGLTPPLVGKILPITLERPATIKTTKGSDDVGAVVVALIEGGIRLSNRSAIRCQVNGTPIGTQADLKDGDRIDIGKQAFRLVASELCSVCDKPFDAVDRVKGWQEADRRICAACLAKGVRPANLANVSPIVPEGEADEETTEAVLPPAAASRPEAAESDRHRRQRRLSASRLAQVDQPAGNKGGILSKVGQVFGNREGRKRLEHMEEERRALLEQAGRLALSEGNGFGIPDHLYNPLLKGVQVTLRLQDFAIDAIERWRSVRSRLAVLDTEIAALRATLGLGPDEGSTLPPVPLASDQRAKQEEAFAMMDGLATMELEGEDPLDDQIEAPSATRSSGRHPKSISGRKMQRRRR